MQQEVMVFYSKHDDLGAWRDALGAEAPEIVLKRLEEIDDLHAVRSALVWKPPIGFFQRFPNLALVVNLGAGVDALVQRDDLPDLPITRISDPKMAQMMAAFVLFAVTRHAREIVTFQKAQRRREWHYVHPSAPGDIRVGILGLGELGLASALECARQGYRVGGWSRTPKTVAGIATASGLAELPSFLADCDIAVCLLPHTPETAGLLDANRLAMLKPGAKFINVSRGSIVAEGALIAALRSGHISEATLDVFAAEPLPAESPLWEMENVLITPHVASIALPASAARQIAENLRRVRNGEEVLSSVDASRGY